MPKQTFVLVSLLSFDIILRGGTENGKSVKFKFEYVVKRCQFMDKWLVDVSRKFWLNSSS